MKIAANTETPADIRPLTDAELGDVNGGIRSIIDLILFIIRHPGRPIL